MSGTTAASVHTAARLAPASGFSFRRLAAVLWLELQSYFRRPALWILTLLLVLVSWGLTSGSLTISTGDSSVGGTKAWLNAEFNLALILVLVSSLTYAFFVSVGAGLSVLGDDENRVSEVIHTTPLRPAEYVWGKFGGVLAAFLLVALLHFLASIFFYQLWPIENPEELRGPFELSNYLRPFALFVVPLILFYAGIAFAVGERFRRPIVVFIAPTVIFLASGFFLWSWSPSWLDPKIDRLLMLIEPSAYRWLNNTWLQLDRGVDFYNTAALGTDLTFWLNRLWVLAVPLLAVSSSVRHLRTAIAGDQPSGTRLGRAWARFRKKDNAVEAKPPTETHGALTHAASPLATLRMTSTPVSLVRTLLEVARAELRELRGQPGLYLFVPLIVLQIVGSSLALIGAFDTPLLLTSGRTAVSSFNTISLLVCLLLLFYTVESLVRELRTGVSPLVYSAPMRTAAFLFGKALANSFVGVVVVLGALVGAVIAILVQGKVPLEGWPFVLVWGILLLPTFLLWSSFVIVLFALLRERYTTYALGIAALAATGYFQLTGKMTWVYNWNLWGALRWSDMGAFELGRGALVLNRVIAVTLAVGFTALAMRLFRRRDLDAGRIAERLRPMKLLRTGLRLAPWFLIPLVAGVILASQVRNGFQSEAAEKADKDYWRKNLATYRDFELPRVTHLELDMKLEPNERSFEVAGTFGFHNHLDEEIRLIPFTASQGLEAIAWKINGHPVEPEERSLLFELRPPEPLLPDETLTVSFETAGVVNRGTTKNGGGASVFALPSGVVVHVLGPSFMPLPGFIESIGVDDENEYEPREYEDDFWESELTPALGNPTPFSTRATITAPAEYTVNSVGELVSESESNGQRTVVWQSDYPVKIFNIVAGRWDVARGDGVAVFYHPEHHYNVDEMVAGLEAAREHYSEWFYPYPWKELKLSEFPGLASYAQGFPTNITFSEDIGFLTDSDPKTNLAFMVTAHEAAHQWWGNLVTPGEGPGGNVISEGMSHYSTLLLQEEEYGLAGRIELAKRFEERYGENRSVDSERPLVKIDGSRTGDNTVTYDKGGWVMWMLHDLMGSEAALAGLQELVRKAIPGPDHPVLQDLVETLRPHAPEPEAFADFVDQWYFDVVLPEYRVSDAQSTKSGAQWVTTATVENRGTGRMPVEVAVTRGERFPEQGEDEDTDTGSGDAEPWEEARTTITLGAGELQAITITSSFEPQQVIVDPDVRVLQLDRKRALAEL